MKNIVIVGAGPIGLYTAIRLKQAGVNNVIVVDPRAEKKSYTRPGDIDPANFDEVGKDIGHQLHSSASRHIKDMERSLYDIATRQYGIDIRRQSFQSFSKGGMTVHDAESKNTVFIPCDLAFDATGSKRVLVHEVNKQMGEGTFPVERVADNPLPDFFIAYGKVKKEDADLLRQPKRSASEPVQHTLALEKLRTEFGWPEFDEPYFRPMTLDKNKVLLYFETPPDLPAEQQQAWLQALMALKTGKKEIAFERMQVSPEDRKKPVFLPFKVDPQRVTSFIYEGNGDMPAVIPIGDAQIDPDARLRIGIDSGTDRVKALLESITVTGGELAVDKDKYQEKASIVMDDHMRRLDSLYAERSMALKTALDKEAKDYLEALSLFTLAPDNEANRAAIDKIENGLMAIIDKNLAYGDQYWLMGNDYESKLYYTAAMDIYLNPHFYNFNYLVDVLRHAIVEPMDDLGEFSYKQFVKAALGRCEEAQNAIARDEILGLRPVALDYYDILDIIDYAGSSRVKYIKFETLTELLKHVTVPQGDKQEIDATTVLNYALVLAIGRKDENEVRLLLKANADINHRDANGNTLLNQALMMGETRLVIQLLGWGADPNLPDSKGKTPIMIAVEQRDSSLIDKLIEHGAEPPEELKKKRKAEQLSRDLTQAVEYDDIEEVKYLLAQGANPNSSTNSMELLLNVIIQDGKTDLLTLFLENGADPNMANFRGATPLMKAALKGNTHMIEILLAHGADTGKKDKRGNDLFKYAEHEPSLVIEIQGLIEKRQASLQTDSPKGAGASQTGFGLFAHTENNQADKGKTQPLNPGKKHGN